MTHTRRYFIKTAGLGSLALVSPIPVLSENWYSKNPNSELHISIFSKHLQFLNYNDACDVARQIGFNGLDLTVRPKGHVSPENVEEDLPKATDAMLKYGMEPLMIASNVSDANSPADQMLLSTASKLGYKYYRPAWYKYQNEG